MSFRGSVATEEIRSAHSGMRTANGRPYEKDGGADCAPRHFLVHSAKKTDCHGATRLAMTTEDTRGMGDADCHAPTALAMTVGKRGLLFLIEIKLGSAFFGYGHTETLGH